MTKHSAQRVITERTSALGTRQIGSDERWRGHVSRGGFCEICGSVWPCGTARRVSDEIRAPYGVTLTSMIDGAGGCRGERRRLRLPTVRAQARDTSRPMTMGYLRVRARGGAASIVTGLAGLESFARDQGWTLGEVFVDDDPVRPRLAWTSLMVAARWTRPAAVVIPDGDGLRPPSPVVLDALRARLAREIGVPLMVVRVAPTSGGVFSPRPR